MYAHVRIADDASMREHFNATSFGFCINESCVEVGYIVERILNEPLGICEGCLKKIKSIMLYMCENVRCEKNGHPMLKKCFINGKCTCGYDRVPFLTAL